MSKIEDQIEVIQYIQLKHRLFRKELPKEEENFTKNIIMDIVDDLEETKFLWCEKWK